CHARHLGGECSHRLTAAIRIIVMPIHVTTKLVAETVVTLARSNLRCHPERAAQASIAVLGKLGAPPEHARLTSRQIKTAELEKLPVVLKSAKVPGLGQNGQRIDRSNPGYHA